MKTHLIELKHLKYFVALAEELNFSRAAFRCHLTQPPFSRSIKQLESYLELKLVERTSRQVTLTDEGKEFYLYALQITQKAENSFKQIHQFSQGTRKTLRVGFHGSMIYRHLPELIQTFKKQEPDIQISLYELPSIAQLDAVIKDDLDLGFTHSLIVLDNPSIQCINLFSERFVLCVPKTFKVQKNPVDLKAFKDMNFIIFGRDASPHYFDMIIAICLQAGFSPKIEHHSKQWLTTLALVSKGLGVALVPECLKNVYAPDVVFYDIDTHYVSNLQCIYSQKRKQPELECFSKLAQKIIRVN